jgi:hypothetical protein
MMMALGFLVACCFSLRMTLFVCFLSFFGGMDGSMVWFDAHLLIELFLTFSLLLHIMPLLVLRFLDDVLRQCWCCPFSLCALAAIIGLALAQ